tara:strand:+ start:6531 stop:7766 length:1236 start_codon:yes stop_codon:yes gene_type:complete
MAEENDLGWKLTPLDNDGNPMLFEKDEVKAKEPEATEVETATEETKEEVPETTKEGEVPPEDANASIAEVEATQEVANEEVPEEKVEATLEKVTTEQPKEIDEQAVLQFLKDRHQKEFTSIDEVLLNNDKQQSEDLSEDIKTYLKFKQETGRTMQDFLMAQRDVSSLDDSSALFEWYKDQNPHLSVDDIQYLIDEKFLYDKDEDDAKVIKGKQIAYKDEVYKAKKYLAELTDKYKIPLESSEKNMSGEAQEALKFYSEYKEETIKSEQHNKALQDVFKQKTDSLFNEEFKGFEFNVGKKKLMFKLSSPEEVKKSQSDINNMLSRYTDEQTGALGDAYQFHKSAFAMSNPDLIAKLAYEQGLSDATNNIVKETKNIDMTVRSNQVNDKSGTKYRVLESESDFSGGLKMKKRK